MQIEIFLIIMQVSKHFLFFTMQLLFSKRFWIRLTETESGASPKPCAENYAGGKPFSEPEALVLAEFIKSFDNIRLYLSFHSYGQMLLFPYVSK